MNSSLLVVFVFVGLALSCSPPLADGTNPCDGKCPTINGNFDLSTNVVCSDGTTYVPTCLFNGTSCSCQWNFPTQDICSSTTPCTDPASCIATCAPMKCALACPNGYVRDSHNCETCQCVDTCVGIACPMIACAEGQTIQTDSCCPVCSTPPAQCLIACPTAPTSCPPNTIPSVDVCGCVTCVQTPLCASPCPMYLCAQNTVSVTLPGDCCATCQPVVNCSLVACAAVACGDGFKSVVKDGQCCPSCEPISSCTGVTCDNTACGTGFERQYLDGFCCPQCVPINKCASVVCPMYACALEQTTLRDGSCCYACSQCRENESGEKVCDRNDNLVCRPDFAGANCDVPVPTGELHHEDFVLKVLNTTVVGDAGKALWVLLDKARGIPREWVEIRAKKRATSYSGSVICKTSAAECTTAVQTMRNALASDTTVQLATLNNSAASAIVFSLALIIVALIAPMM